MGVSRPPQLSVISSQGPKDRCSAYCTTNSASDCTHCHPSKYFSVPNKISAALRIVDLVSTLVAQTFQYTAWEAYGFHRH